MTDAQLADFLNLTDGEAKIIIAKILPPQREAYERMREAAESLEKGITPAGVIVCRRH